MASREHGGGDTDDLASVRSELRRLGYLDHRLERYLLQDALRPRRPLGALLLLVLRVGLAVGVALALALALGLAAANGNLSASPVDLLPLFLHLFLPISAAATLAFLALCGLVLLVLRLYHVRHIESLSLGTAVAAGAAGLASALWQGRDLIAGGSLWQRAAVLLAAPAVAYLVVRLVDQGLLALAVRFTESAPGRLVSGRRLGLGLLSAGFLLTLPAVLAAGRGAPPPPAAFPSAPGERVLLLGIDGVLPEELDYLLRAGDLPALGRLAAEGAVRAYRRPAEPPASFWTSVATGLPSSRHGVAALDSFRPLGVRTPLARNGPLRAYWSAVAVPLGLAEYRPLLANRRSAFTLWELAARGGEPALAVNWWATFPAEPLPGLVVAHGAYQLLAEGAAAAVEPPAARPGLARLAAGAAAAPPDPRLAAALPPASRAAVLERALAPDLFYRQAFARALASAPRAAALYLPGLDIAADGWPGGGVAFADLVRRELAAADRLLAGGLAGVGTVAVVVDPGRRRGGRAAGEGRVLLWRRQGCGAAGRPRIQPGDPAGKWAGKWAGQWSGEEAGADLPLIAPEAVAAALLRALGLPQSAELPAPPGVCPWPEPPAVVAGYGAPRRRSIPVPQRGEQSREYLESLRSLGYL